MKKPTFNVMLDTRDDGTRVFTAKCFHCDAVIVGEATSWAPVVQAMNHLPPQQQQKLPSEVRKAWLAAKEGGFPFTLPSPDLAIVTWPNHGLQHALDAHIEKCPKKS